MINYKMNDLFTKFCFLVRTLCKIRGHDYPTIDLDKLLIYDLDVIKDNWFPRGLHFNLPIEDTTLNSKMERWVTMYQLLHNLNDTCYRYDRLLDEITTFEEFIELSYYIITKGDEQYSDELLNKYLNKDRIIKRNNLIKDELIQVTHKIF